MNRRQMDALLKKIESTEHGGNERVKEIVNRLVRDLFYLIEDLDVQPDEFWKAIDFLTQAGKNQEYGLIAPGLGFEHFLDLRMDEAEMLAGIKGGTPRTIEGPLYVAGAPVSNGFARLDDGKEVDEGNWKLQAENGADGYHVSAVHWNYVATTNRRKTGESKTEIKAMDASKWAKQAGGFYAFEHGHIMLWTAWADPTNRPAFKMYEEWKEKFGEAKARWMVGNLRNLCIYPNVFFMDQFSTQIRMWRPISVNKTEVTIYCFAPVNEPAETRTHRIRQYEDFFNASGMATPDDLEEFRASQSGYEAASMEWNDISRGAKHWIQGADENAAGIGMKPLLSGAKTEDEGLFMMQHKYWLEVMTKAITQAESDDCGAN